MDTTRQPKTRYTVTVRLRVEVEATQAHQLAEEDIIALVEESLALRPLGVDTEAVGLDSDEWTILHEMPRPDVPLVRARLTAMSEVECSARDMVQERAVPAAATGPAPWDGRLDDLLTSLHIETDFGVACDACQAVAAETDTAPLYECNACGEVFNRDNSSDGTSHRCPSCHKFAALLDEESCLECSGGPVHTVQVVSCPTCEEIILAQDFVEHWNAGCFDTSDDKQSTTPPTP